MDLIEYKNASYIVLLPTEGEDDDQVVILQAEDLGSTEEAYISIDDEKTLQQVYRIFKKKFKKEFNFV